MMLATTAFTGPSMRNKLFNIYNTSTYFAMRDFILTHCTQLRSHLHRSGLETKTLSLH